MIATANKILGEPNDPNTVIAVDTLTPGLPIVGAGNKGIKTLDVGPNRILYTNSKRQLVGFKYNEPNKIIATDANGDLILKDMPASFQNILIASVSAINSTFVSVRVYNIGDANLPVSIAEKLEQSGDISIIELVNNSITGNIEVLLSCTLKTPLNLSNTGKIRTLLTISTESAELNIEGISLVGSNVSKKNILDQGIRQMVSVNKVLSLNAGIYNELYIEKLIVPAGTHYIEMSGCFVGVSEA